MMKGLQYFLIFLLPSNVSGAIQGTWMVECQTMTIPDSTGSLSEQDVCAESVYRSPPVECGDDGTVTNSDPYYWDTFYFYNKEDEWKDVWIDEPTPIGLAVEVGRNEAENDACYVKATTTYVMDQESDLWDECNRCTYCGNNAYSADCTNIPNGRIVDCEVSAFDWGGSTIFFPFTSAALTGEVAEESSPPSMSPTMPPTLQPTTSPTGPPTKNKKNNSKKQNGKGPSRLR